MPYVTAGCNAAPPQRMHDRSRLPFPPTKVATQPRKLAPPPTKVAPPPSCKNLPSSLPTAFEDHHAVIRATGEGRELYTFEGPPDRIGYPSDRQELRTQNQERARQKRQ